MDNEKVYKMSFQKVYTALVNKALRKDRTKDEVKLVDELAKGKSIDSIKRKSCTEVELWKCPKCNKEFKKENQSHFCGEKPKTIDKYILAQDESIQKELFHMREVLAQALPETQERISWSMPTFWKNHNIIHFAASKKHIGLYPGPAAIEFFADKLSDYKTSKGTIRIPYGKIDEELITSIAKWCIETDNRKE